MVKNTMPQLDLFTFFGQVSWLSLAFVFYFVVMGTSVLPLINRSLKLREKKLSYQLSFGKGSVDIQSLYDGSRVTPMKEINKNLSDSRKGLILQSIITKNTGFLPLKALFKRSGSKSPSVAKTVNKSKKIGNKV